jgi:hypothetical protein|tara:strand:- start:322 stop:840 length:519 start_codon:yes stop_codon:yes gene_type:complete
MKYEIIDNFLEPREFNALKGSILDIEFPWFAYSGITESKFGKDGKLSQALTKEEHWAFFHLFYQNYQPNSKFFNSLTNLIEKLEIQALLRSKANLYPRTTEVVEHNFHYDFAEPHKSALLSLNTNNGFTILGDGTKIESIENRIVLFDASELHKSTTCSDANYRANIVINWK